MSMREKVVKKLLKSGCTNIISHKNIGSITANRNWPPRP